ncbi:T-complex 11 [Paraphysoderma sedebokerense]|nr:T-complex 11 [Paraphysoderma sedebokerense]
MIAHELIVDPNFKLGPSEEDNLTARVRKMAMKAFYDSLRELTVQGNFTWVPDLIIEIKEGIKSLTVEKGRMTTLIDEALDVELIRQQIEKNVFDLNGCLNTVVQILLQLCAPVRDEAVRAILSSPSTDIPAIFESIMDVIDVMKLDLANFRLEQLRPILKAQAVEYESTKFRQSLSSGETSLTKTTAWLQESFESLAQVSAARNPENIQHPENKLKYEDIYHDAVLSLLFSSTGINPTNIPETLALDGQRMFNLQNEIQGINVVAALIMISRNMLSRDAFAAAAPKLREVLFVLIKDSETKLENLSTQVIKTINDTLSASPSSSASTSKSLDASQESFITTMISKTLNTKDKLYSILSRRIQTTIKNHLSSGKFKKDGLSAAGLDVVEKELEGVSEKVYRLAKHNKEVYREWYDQILRGFVQG